MEWRDTDPSDEEQNQQEDSRSTYRKRSSRACDQCRKTKSKCERPSGDGRKCKSCQLAGTECTFLGPSYKRGPPKGYIHAIEQRWHQVESLLGAVLQCRDPTVQGIVADLRQDDLAREILDRVDTGPYGPSGRRSRPADATKEDFFASILRSNESSHPDSSRTRRQSRVSREIVSSNQDHGLSVVPTKQWQDNLSDRLAFSSSARNRTELPGHPLAQRRRLNNSNDSQSPSTWDTLYTIEPNNDADDFKTAAEGIGELSLDEHQEVRFHGQSSGLHLLGRSQRTDDRIDGGIWRLPMARVWPPSKFGISTYPFNHVPVDLPPQHIQDKLIDLYFTNIHPVFPVIHKSRFLSEYHARYERVISLSTTQLITSGSQSRDPSRSPGTPSASTTFSSPRPEPTQEVTNLLLFSIFAISARFMEENQPQNPDHENKMWDGGCEYLDSARNILTKVFHISRPSTVQALLLLGYREFGIGSMEQGWIFIGMGIRMAFDLGLNCDSAKWRMHDHDLFSPEETQVRRQIWWACVLTDRYGSIYMGRPTMIKDEDHETPLPNVDPIQERQPWQPSVTKDDIPYPPVPARVMGAFCASSRLAMIIGAIVTEIYPIRPTPGVSRQSLLLDLESRLDQWYITLPDELRYDSTNKKFTPPTQILFLHVRYWGAVLLLHRALTYERPHESTIGTRAFDLARIAACHISSIVFVYRDTFTMKKTSPFLTSYLFSAGIMHVLTLTLRPDSIEASHGLEQCMTTLKEMEIVWPSASRARALLNGVQLRTVPNLTPQGTLPYQQCDRNKRPAETAFGEDKSSIYGPQAATFDMGGNGDMSKGSGPSDGNGVQDISTRLMAHMLGLEMPGIEPSTSYFPGYEWWPRISMNQGLQAPPVESMPYPPNPDFSGNGGGMGTHAGPSSGEGNVGEQGWMGNGYDMGNVNYPYVYSPYEV